MTKKLRSEINALARLFYSMHGYNAPAGYDFGKASHPQERSMFNLAKAAIEFCEARQMPVRKGAG